MAAVGCPRWGIVARDLPPDAPAVVVEANRVVSSSPEALALGVRRGMRRREAQARCPEIVVIDHDPAADARAFEHVVEVVESFSPRVEIVRPGLCLLGARGPARYFGGEQALRTKVAEAVDDAVRRHRTHPLHPDDRCRVGIADGPFAAELAAVRGAVVEPGSSPSFLAAFEVGVLDAPDRRPYRVDAPDRRPYRVDAPDRRPHRVDAPDRRPYRVDAPDRRPYRVDAPELCDLLVRLGIRTLGDLAALPADKVVARFGLEGAIAHRRARGEDDRLLEPRSPPPDLTVTRELDPVAHRVDVAMFAGKAAADELIARLAELGLACARLAITVQTEHHLDGANSAPHREERTRTWRYSAAFTSAAVAERVRWQLEGWAGTLSGGIALLRLVPEDVGPATGAQTGFWGKRHEVSDTVHPMESLRSIQRAVARVQGLLGPEGARQMTLSGGRHPSEQWASVPWGDPASPARPGLPGEATVRGPVTVELPPWPGRLPAPSPAVVLERPRPVEVVDASGEAVGVTGRFAVTAPPARLRLNGWHEVAAWSGPWPTDERWWDTDVHRRRARFQVVLADGSAHLLALEDGHWHLEATYD